MVRNPYILLTLAYQVLFSMGTRLVDYLFLQQARSQFTTAEALTRFFGTMMAAATVLTFLFVAFIAGKILTRFGMGVGLAGNPVGVGRHRGRRRDRGDGRRPRRVRRSSG